MLALAFFGTWWFWFVAVELIALFFLVRGADTFVTGAKQVGSSLGMSKFAIGVLIVGFGTSLPELASSIAAALSGATEIVLANAVGSNITNILLVVGVLAADVGQVESEVPWPGRCGRWVVHDSQGAWFCSTRSRTAHSRHAEPRHRARKRPWSAQQQRDQHHPPTIA